MNWRELIQSKKFKVLVASLIGLIVAGLATDGTLTPEVIKSAVNLVMVYLGAQGAADLGKAWNGSRK